MELHHCPRKTSRVIHKKEATAFGGRGRYRNSFQGGFRRQQTDLGEEEGAVARELDVPTVVLLQYSTLLYWSRAHGGYPILHLDGANRVHVTNTGDSGAGWRVTGDAHGGRTQTSTTQCHTERSVYLMHRSRASAHATCAHIGGALKAGGVTWG